MSRPEPIAVEDDDAVRQLRGLWTEACVARDTLASEERQLRDMLDPPPVLGSQPTVQPFPEEVLAAKARYPAVQVGHALAASKVKTLEKQLVGARTAAQRTLNEARAELRRPLVAAVFKAFEAAVDANEDLMRFDQQTRAMGGSESANPTPDLNKERFLFQRGLAERDGSL